jgi:hypothetical protein
MLGELAQLVARVLSMDKVAGSIPAFSTFIFVLFYSGEPAIGETINESCVIKKI